MLLLFDHRNGLPRCTVSPVWLLNGDRDKEEMKEEIPMMTPEESYEFMSRQGANPVWLDGRIPLFENHARAGEPADIGDVYYEPVPFPRGIAKNHILYRFEVAGDSMKKAGINDGDMLTVCADVSPRDGDIIVADLDGEYTVKAYCIDDSGELWLVPFNEEYDAIHVTPEKNFRCAGKVVEITKKEPRTTFRDCMKIIKRSKDKECVRKVTKEQQEYAIREISKVIGKNRHWYAVYRALLDAEKDDGAVLFGRGRFDAFCELVSRLVPDHRNLPTAQELQRMAVLSFDKPIKRWDVENAPVSGAHFYKYLDIARQMQKLLEE